MTHMARRISAVLGILAILVLVLLLMWRVYLHHRAGGDEDDEPGVIASLSAPHSAGPWHADC